VSNGPADNLAAAVVAASAPAGEAVAPAAPAPEAAAAPAAPEKPAPRRLTRTRAEKPVEAPVEAAPVKAEQPERGARLLSRMRAQIERDRGLVEEAKGYRAELAEYAASALGGISKEARSYVEKVAGDNPAKQLATLRELKAAGLLGAPSAPANSAPKAAPPQGAQNGDSDAAILAEYERLRKVAPIIALDYQQRNRDALQRARSRN
jgi:hypothetical protein